MSPNEAARNRRAWWSVALAMAVASGMWIWTQLARPDAEEPAKLTAPGFPWNRGDQAQAPRQAASAASHAGGNAEWPSATRTPPAASGDDPAIERYAAARQHVLQDSSLNLLDKARRLTELRAVLPPNLRARLSPGDNVSDLNALVADWSSSKGSPQELRALREELVGVRGADQLEALDTFRGTWAQQIRSFNQQRRAVMTDNSLSDLQRTESLTRLREQTSAELERLRGQAPIGDNDPLVKARAPCCH